MRLTLPLAAAALALCAAPVMAADARGLYMDNCSACHQPTGKGIDGAFPALAGSKAVVGSAVEPITRVLKGRGGMPSFATELTDLEIAQILTFVRTNWGNKGAPVQPKQVTALRTGAKRENAKASLLAH